MHLPGILTLPGTSGLSILHIGRRPLCRCVLATGARPSRTIKDLMDGLETGRVTTIRSNRQGRPSDSSIAKRTAAAEVLELSKRALRNQEQQLEDGVHDADHAHYGSIQAAVSSTGSQESSEGVTEGFPARYKIVLACMMSFVICNMDKVNMSVAIIPMAQQFGWSPSVAGIVQSSFFYGYMASQLPSGYLANRYSGRWVLPGGVGTWSLFTAAVPLFSASIPTLCISRAAVGFGEGVAPSAVNDIVVNSVPKNERARAISTIFGGLHIGSIAGLLLAPPLIAHFGWQAVFYVFGALGLVWIAGFEVVVRGKGKEMKALRSAMRSEEATTGHSTGVPFRAFVRNGPVRALMFTHFVNNWFHYTMLAWLPTYFTQTLSLGIRDASMVALLPSIAGVIVSSLSGQLADGLIESGMAVRRVRTLAQTTAFLLPAVCLCCAGLFEGQQLAIAFISAALGLNSFALSGLYCTHGDMSTKYAGPLLGLTNTSGAVPGIIGVVIVGILYDVTRSWALALFAPCCVFFVLGTVVYATAASSEAQDFDDDSPFAIEGHVANFWRQLGGKQE